LGKICQLIKELNMKKTNSKILKRMHQNLQNEENLFVCILFEIFCDSCLVFLMNILSHNPKKQYLSKIDFLSEY